MIAALSWLQAGILTPAGAGDTNHIRRLTEKTRNGGESVVNVKISLLCLVSSVQARMVMWGEERADVNIDIWDNVCPERGRGAAAIYFNNLIFIRGPH